MKLLKTKHGNIQLPNFFPTIGWPGGRGEYDYLFKNLKYFCQKFNHYHFLFNFSSFIFGFTIPKHDFHPDFDALYVNSDFRNIIADNTNATQDVTKNLIILLDIGGNRIFNKIVMENLPPISVSSYNIYLEAHKKFISHSNIDIYVAFEIGPSYTTKDAISKKGINIWNSLSEKEKYRINQNLSEIAMKYKPKDSLLMCAVNASDPNLFRQKLEHLYKNYKDKIDIIGIAGIANSSTSHIANVLKQFNEIKNSFGWNILSHGLGLGGWRNIPLLVKYDIDTCDVATPWRRACTDSISAPYLPLFDKDLSFTNISNSCQYLPLYDNIYTKLNCRCPICTDTPMQEIRRRCMKADKRKTGKQLHDDDFREMRIRIFFHNYYQHKALIDKMNIYKTKYGEKFIDKFLEDMPQGRTRNILKKSLAAI